MKLLADECCDSALVSFLRKEGHDVLYVMEEKPGSLDSEVLEKAKSEKRIIITEDKDFGELVYRLKLEAEGIILLRFKVNEAPKKLQQIKILISEYKDRLKKNLVVVNPDGFRFRPL
ncbi:MAG: DUF5615 family PIN-like protein [Bacteroidales bacterium]|nr:DUF5615 family PIN-like protein [Bacteroidales bacterium]